MSHEIDMSTGQAAVFVSGQPAWHQLGTVVAEAVTSAEAVKLARLDWRVEQRPIFLGDGRKIPQRVANVRTDTGIVLGVVSTDYQVFQNWECFDFMDALVAEKLAMFETAGALKEGRQVWMLARIPKELRAAGSDVIDPYVLLTNGHDGGTALRMIPTSVRVVCNNTLNLALRRAGDGVGFTLHHSKNLQARVEEARRTLGIVLERIDRFQEQITSLASASVTEREARDYWEKLFPTRPRKGGEVLAGDGAALADASPLSRAARLALGQPTTAQQSRAHKRNAQIQEQLLQSFHSPTNTLPGIRDTLWAAFNAVTHWVDHQSPVRGKDVLAQPDSRMHSIFLGRGDALKQEAFKAALELAATD